MPELSPVNPLSDWGPRCDGSDTDDVGNDLGDMHYTNAHNFADIGDDAEMIEYLQSYHPGTGAMVAMGGESDEPQSAEYGIGGSHLGSRYDDGVLMTQIGIDDVGSKRHTQHNHMATHGFETGDISYDDGVLMTEIGYEMYSEYGAHPHQVIPYMGFGPAAAQTDYPHGPFDEPDMGADRGHAWGRGHSHGHAYGKRKR